MDKNRSPPRGAQLHVDKLIAKARGLTGLTDLGDPYFMEPLQALIDRVNAEGGLVSDEAPPVQIVIAYLGDRLRFVDYLKRHPAIRDQELHVRGLIHCHARGGSTLLHRLLATSPQLTATRIWEMAAPVPLEGEKVGDPSRRIQMGQAWINAFMEEVPGYTPMHPMSAEDVEEEELIMDRSFVGGMWLCHFYVPTYLEWMRQYDHTKVYEELKLWLQLMQYQTPGREMKKWILKASSHLLGGNLEVAMHAFPDAKIIMTHRRMEEVLVSLCSVRNQHLQLYSNTYNPKNLGHELISYYEPAIRDAIRIRDKGPSDRFINVQYRDLVADPVKVFETVLRAMGLTVGSADIQSAKAWMASNERSTFPAHKYAAEDYGFTKELLANRFDHYHKAFQVK